MAATVVTYAAQIRRLRVTSTVLLGFAIGQAGFAAGYIGGTKPLLIVHATNAFGVLLAAAVSTLVGLGARRSGLPGWTFVMPLTLLLAVLGQMTLGFLDVKALHVFLGVLILCAVTTYCSYSWRLKLPVGQAAVA